MHAYVIIPSLLLIYTDSMQHFSDYSEAYVDPGDIVTKGADFLAEAERLRDEEPAKLSLAFLQGTLLLYERFAVNSYAIFTGACYLTSTKGIPYQDTMTSVIRCSIKRYGRANH